MSQSKPTNTEGQTDGDHEPEPVVQACSYLIDPDLIESTIRSMVAVATASELSGLSIQERKQKIIEEFGACLAKCDSTPKPN